MPAAPAWRFASKQYSFIFFKHSDMLDCQFQTFIFSNMAAESLIGPDRVGFMCIIRRGQEVKLFMSAQKLARFSLKSLEQ